MTRRRQAVVLIHGIGEQMPLHTLKRFVENVWALDPESHAEEGRFWSKPDPLSGSVVLPKLVARARGGALTDFFEFYWAHYMTETKLSHVLAWARVLLLRWPWGLPPRLRWVWLVLVGAIVATIGAAAYLHQTPFNTTLWWSALAALIGSWIVDFAVIRTLGDAARYLHHTARNTGRRVEVLTKGVELLRDLHESGRYDRIIVVGHSLGSVIGYEMLAYAWSLYNVEFDKSRHLDQRAQSEVEGLAGDESLDAYRYQQAQGAYQEELRQNGHKWRVTDFVTLGSPLTYAAVLIASDAEELRLRQEEREFPTCPPQLDHGVHGDGRRFTYISEDPDHVRVPHYSAVFGPTRWTNIYFSGDLVGGPLGPVFGLGIRDMRVQTKWWNLFVCHTRYWSLPQRPDVPNAVDALRRVISDRPEDLRQAA